MALIPIETYKDAWKIIIDNMPSDSTGNFIKFIKYFINTWLIGKLGSQFSPAIWNHFNSELVIRTNSNIEGFHSKIN